MTQVFDFSTEQVMDVAFDPSINQNLTGSKLVGRLHVS